MLTSTHCVRLSKEHAMICATIVMKLPAACHLLWFCVCQPFSRDLFHTLLMPIYSIECHSIELLFITTCTSIKAIVRCYLLRCSILHNFLKLIETLIVAWCSMQCNLITHKNNSYRLICLFDETGQLFISEEKWRCLYLQQLIKCSNEKIVCSNLSNKEHVVTVKTLNQPQKCLSFESTFRKYCGFCSNW